MALEICGGNMRVKCINNPYGFAIEVGKIYEAEEQGNYYDVYFGNNNWGVYPKFMFMRIYGEEE